MDNEKYLKEVREQYEMYPYPMRDPADEKKRLIAMTDGFLEHINHYCFKGRQRFDRFRILVAGKIFERVRTTTGQMQLTDEVLLQHFRPLYYIFNRVEWMLLRNRTVDPFKTVNELQAPVSMKYKNDI